MDNVQKRTREAWRRERIARIRHDGKVRREVCPKCGAEVGEDCHATPSWYSVAFHVGRLTKAGVR